MTLSECAPGSLAAGNAALWAFVGWTLVAVDGQHVTTPEEVGLMMDKKGLIRLSFAA
eukprot:gene39888-36917_t